VNESQGTLNNIPEEADQARVIAGSSGGWGGRLSEVWIIGTGHSSCLSLVQEQYFLSSEYKFFLDIMAQLLRNEKDTEWVLILESDSDEAT